MSHECVYETTISLPDWAQNEMEVLVAPVRLEGVRYGGNTVNSTAAEFLPYDWTGRICWHYWLDATYAIVVLADSAAFDFQLPS